MKMIRTFFPIGQGVFCKETFSDEVDKFTFIYDCGTLTPNTKKRLEKCIHGAFEEKEVIEAVFLSHLDADHFNGLPELLKHCQVKKIFFPLLSDDEKLLLKEKLLFDNVVKTDFVFYYQFIDNPKTAIKQILRDNMQMPKLYEVKEVSNDNDNSRPSNDFPVMDSPQNTEKPADSQTREFGNRNLETAFFESDKYWKIKVRLYDKGNVDKVFLSWKYYLFNIPQPPTIFEDFKANLEVEQLDIETVRKFTEKYYSRKITDSNATLKKIKKAYQNLKESAGEKFNLNEHSLVVYSGPNEKDLYQRFVPVNNEIRYINLNENSDKIMTISNEEPDNSLKLPAGCLFMGDYNLRKNASPLLAFIQQDIPKIGCIQIPHHGSIHSWSTALLKEPNLNKDCFFVAEAGDDNTYGHPSSSVWESFILNRGSLDHVFWVSEDRRTQIFFVVDIE